MTTATFTACPACGVTVEDEGHCVSCYDAQVEREYYARNRARRAAYQREYNARNRERRVAYQREYYARNRARRAAAPLLGSSPPPPRNGAPAPADPEALY